MPTPAELLHQAVDHHRAGRYADAEAGYRALLDVQPRDANGWQLLGLVEYQTQRFEAAVEHIRRCIELGGAGAAIYSNLGAAERACGRIDESRRAFADALRLDPRYAPAHYNLANLYRDAGETEAALEHYRQAILNKPDYAEAYDQQGQLLQARGAIDEAIASYRDSLAREPRNPRALNNLANLLLARNQAPAALALLDQAVALRPDYAKGHNNRGSALRAMGRVVEAEAAFRRALEHDPELFEARNNLATALENQGRGEEAGLEFDRVLAQAPDHPAIHSNALMSMLYRPTTTLAALAQRHREWGTRHEPPGIARPRPEAGWVPDRRLRLGFLSGDFNNHPVGCIVCPLVERLDRAAFEVACYSTQWAHDEMRDRLRRAADRWIDANGLTHEQMADRIRSDQVDVLVDLSGHTAYNQLPVLARRPAPLQITWAGYQATTGLAAIDVLLTDRVLVPPDVASQYRERIVYLPESPWCAEIPVPAPIDPGPPPVDATGFITFGSFNNPAKVGSTVIETWGSLLREVVDSRLILKYRGFDSPDFATWIRDQFQRQGVAPERLVLRGTTPLPEMLREYREIDVALDPFPFTGGMTSLLALWMGVPVVTLVGETLAARQTLSQLRALGETAGIVTDRASYVIEAARLASDRPLLRELRATLRPRLEQSSYRNAGRFVADWSRTVRDVWRESCEAAARGEGR